MTGISRVKHSSADSMCVCYVCLSVCSVDRFDEKVHMLPSLCVRVCVGAHVHASVRACVLTNYCASWILGSMKHFVGDCNQL